MFFQAIIHSVIAASAITLVGLGFHIVFKTARLFHIAHGGLFTVAPYLVLLAKTYGLPILLALLCSVLLTIFLGLAIEWGCYRPIRNHSGSANVLLLASLGILVGLQATLALIFGSEMKSLRSSSEVTIFAIFATRITAAQASMIAFGFVAVLATYSFVRFMRVGRQLEAVANDPELAAFVGVNTERIYLLAAGVGSLLAAVAGIAISYDVDMTPTMGMPALLLGIVAVITGGNSIAGTVLGALLIGTLQHLGTYWLSSRWQDVIIFCTMLIVLIVRPAGILGKPVRRRIR
jgi:branched-chain amino acid transport system permease protein